MKPARTKTIANDGPFCEAHGRVPPYGPRRRTARPGDTILPIKPANPTRNRLLNQLRGAFDTITGNYDFFVGRAEVVQRELPTYKASVAAWCDKLIATHDPEPKVAELAQQLRIAAQ